MTTLRADAARNRDRLIAAAAELFAERGVNAPLEEVAKRAGVSIGTLYNHFPNRGALLDAVLPERLSEIRELACAALSAADPWQGFSEFLHGMFAVQAGDKAFNDAIARSPVGPVDVAAECGQSGGVLIDVVDRAHSAGVLRADFGAEDLATLIWAMSKVIAMSADDDTVWRRHLGFLLDGLRA
ncbi:MAG: TetR/AcrR family transcriptional regulator [Mycobacterium sp.]|nr:TetR/AcrR family transcriptional regulator [Mycobacterium sp.]